MCVRLRMCSDVCVYFSLNIYVQHSYQMSEISIALNEKYDL